VTPHDSLEQIKAQGVHFVLVSKGALIYHYHTTLGSVTTKWSATVVEEKQIELMAHVGPETWCLLRL